MLISLPVAGEIKDVTKARADRGTGKSEDNGVRKKLNRVQNSEEEW